MSKRSPSYNDRFEQDLVYVLLILVLVIIVAWRTGLLEAALR